jgi:DNA polymerase-3 subunit gamma/tau
VLSRCQRFDLRRIETDELVKHLASIAAKEQVKIEPAALASIARAAEGSVRDALSLLDQAIAHGEGGDITAENVRAMLGLVDRGRVLDLFEKVMGGRVAEALNELSELYDRGADPLAIMQDLLEVTHFLTRVKVAPGAEGFFDGGSGEAARSAEMAAKLSVPSLTRAWQLLLKGLFEVRDATKPMAAAEMALIRLAYAADLPPTDKLVRDLLERDSTEPRARPSTSNLPSHSTASAPTPARASQPSGGAATARAAPAPQMAQESAPTLQTLNDIMVMAAAKGASVLKVHLENDVHLVRLEPGQIEFRPGPRAPRTLAGDLAQKLKDWTGTRWVVTLAREGGAASLAEQKREQHAAQIEAVAQEPLVRAVLDRFPGAEIVGVRDRIDDAPAAEEGGEG